jgi:uncharacterized protein with PhoU and TrkA domain
VTPAGEKLDRSLSDSIARFVEPLRKEQIMPEKFANLQGVASAIDKLTSAIEDDAKEVLEDIASVHEKRKQVFGKAKERIAVRKAALEAANHALEKLDEALGDNGGPTLPTSGG